MQRGLQIPGFNNLGSKVLLDLVSFCDEHDAHEDFLEMCERDSAMLIALTQSIIEKRKESGQALPEDELIAEQV